MRDFAVGQISFFNRRSLNGGVAQIGRIARDYGGAPTGDFCGTSWKRRNQR
jgi:hypothetical protein